MQKNTIIYSLLSSKLFVGIGLISYSLYLWHYPIFAFQRYKSITYSNSDIFLWIVITFFLSILTYIFIEKPSRNRKYNFKYLLGILTIPYLAITILCLTIIKNNGVSNRFSESLLNYIQKQEIYDSKNKFCENAYTDNFCKFNTTNNDGDEIILLGDSISNSILTSVAEIFDGSDFKITSMSYSGNIYLPGFSVFNKQSNKIIKDNHNRYFDENWHNFRKKYLEKSNANTYLIILGNYPTYFLEKETSFTNKGDIYFKETNNKFIQKKSLYLNYNERKKELKKHFKKTLLELAKDKKILLFYPIPQAPVEVFRWLLKNQYKLFNDKKNFFEIDKINYDKEVYFDLNKEVISFFDTIDSKNIYKIKTDEIFCPNDKCYFYDDKYVYFKDKVHPSYHTSKIISKIIYQNINIIENSKK